MTWPLRSLCELGDVSTGSTPPTVEARFYGGDVPFVTPAELDSFLPINTTPRTLTEVGAAAARMLPEGAVMVCCIGSLGKTGIAARGVATNQQINSVVFDSQKVWPKFGFYACRQLKPKLECMAPATTLPIVSKSKFAQLVIPVPPLAEQRRIAEVLDRVEALRAKRRAALVQLDTLTQSLFLDLFGDSATNLKGWKQAKLGTLCDVGSSKRVFVEELVEEGIPFYRGTEVGSLGNDETVNPTLFITRTHYEALKREAGVPKLGDLLLPSICSDGRIYIVRDERPFYFKDGRVLWIKAGGSSIDSVFLRYHLKLAFAADYSRIASGTTFAELKIFALKELVVPAPRSNSSESSPSASGSSNGSKPPSAPPSRSQTPSSPRSNTRRSAVNSETLPPPRRARPDPRGGWFLLANRPAAVLPTASESTANSPVSLSPPSPKVMP